MNGLRNSFWNCGSVFCLLIGVAFPTFGQTVVTGSQPGASADEAIEAKINDLSNSLDETRAELAESREEIRQLRAMLEQVSQQLNATGATARSVGKAESSSLTAEQVTTPAAMPAGQPQDEPVPTRPAAANISQDDWDMLNSQVAQLRQTRVESGSKFPLRLSGMFLMNTIVNSGQTDNFDVPTIAITGGNSGGSTGFSLRQSIIGLEGTGPRFLGADTSGDVQADFSGGSPGGYGASVSGVMRLRLARMRVDWAHNSIIGGLDRPFFSPESPTSYLSVAQPEFSGAGNLWAWSPQLRVEQRFETRLTELKAEAGIVDVPSYVNSVGQLRAPSPGENSRQPAYALRISANGRDADHPASFGLAGIYVQEHFFTAGTISGGGGEADWRLPLLSRAEFSGEMFAGKGLDGFGAAPVPVVTTTNYVQYITSSAPLLTRVGMYGGWSQFTFRVNTRSEFNVAAGGVARDAGAFRQAAAIDSIVQGLGFKNESLMFNYVYRPRSDLVFSAEYRRFRTYEISGSEASAGQTGVTAGFIF
jgi:hypothetical protein